VRTAFYSLGLVGGQSGFRLASVETVKSVGGMRLDGWPTERDRIDGVTADVRWVERCRRSRRWFRVGAPALRPSSPSDLLVVQGDRPIQESR
jgi:hypothetical protein